MEARNISFFNASARQRAQMLVDKGTFQEILSAEDGIPSPHLPLMGHPVQADDGIVIGFGKIGKHPIFMISNDGGFTGGSLGEVNGTKMSEMFHLALRAYDRVRQLHPNDWESYRPAVVISYETGGVRLHEANVGLLALAEIMDYMQDTKGKVPVISLIGSKVGCFGGTGFIAAAADVVIMSAGGRLGLTGPKVIEQEMGKEEFDASDRELILRTTGGKHKYIMGDCNYLVEDSIQAFADAVRQVLDEPYEKICACRRIGSYDLIRRQMELVELAAEMEPSDAMDVWKHYGNLQPEIIPQQSTAEFLATVHRREGV